MRSAKLVVLLLGCTLAGGAAAETIIVNGQVQIEQSSVAHPTRGSTMTQVEAKFGAPQKRYPAVGKPPITRWDYSSFSVFFEFNRVVHSVVHG